MSIKEKIAGLFKRREVAALPGEPTVPDLDDSRFIAWRRYAIMGGCLGLLVLGFFVVLKSHGSSGDDDKKRQRQRVTVSDQSFDYVPPVAQQPVIENDYATTYNEPEYYDEPEQEPEAVAYVQPKPEVIYLPAPTPKVPRVPKGRGGSSVMLVGNNAASSGGAAAGNTGSSSGTASGSTQASLPDGVERSYAGRLENTDMLVLQGTPIPCTLITGINTQLPGQTSCSVSKDIWSEDNSRILIAKGSIANGTYQSETSSGAVTRVGVIWGRIKTTDDLVAMLDSPAASPQGMAGIAADHVDYNFWARWGAAFAVSLVDGALRNVSAGDNNADVVVNSATNSGSDIVTEIVRGSIGIPTTRSVLPGNDLIIYLNKDISFERVY